MSCEVRLDCISRSPKVFFALQLKLPAHRLKRCRPHPAKPVIAKESRSPDSALGIGQASPPARVGVAGLDQLDSQAQPNMSHLQAGMIVLPLYTAPTRRPLGVDVGAPSGLRWEC